MSIETLLDTEDVIILVTGQRAKITGTLRLLLKVVYIICSLLIPYRYI